MFENMTYETILKNVMARISADVDKRQGSVIYDAVAPACAELANCYIYMENILDNSFADTACREYLVLRAKERGIEPYAATAAVARGVFNCEIPVGSRFSIGSVNFAVTEKITDFEYKMTCETVGTVGNKTFGTLIPIEYIENMTSAMLTEILVPGREEEDTEDFRNRYFEELYGDAFGGNRADYKKWIKAIDGVGQVRVERADSNNNNVKVYIRGSDGSAPSSELLNIVKEKIDPVDKQGLGYGLAPIGHSVQVSGVKPYYINIIIEGEFENGTNTTQFLNRSEEVINDYFNELNDEWENSDDGIKIYSAQIIVRLLKIDGVKNITSALLNGKSYIKIDSDCIAKLDYIDME